MLKNYFLTTIRTLRQNPFYTILSLLGVAVTFVFICFIFMLSRGLRNDYRLSGYTDRTWVVQGLTNENQERKRITPEFYRQYVTKMKTPEAVIVRNPQSAFNINVNGQSVMLNIAYIEGDYFDVCRLKFLEGRAITKDEMSENRPVMVIDKYTADKCFRNESAIGKKMNALGRDFEITGVVNNTSFLEMMAGPGYSNLWVPLSFIREKNPSLSLYLTAADETSLASVRNEFDNILKEAGAAEGNILKADAKVLSQKTGINYSATFTTIFIIMLIPALNILSLNIAKSHNRSEETAVRKVFGASNKVIFRQLLMETVLLTTVGAFIGAGVTPFILKTLDNILTNKMMMTMPFALQFNIGIMALFIVPCILVFSLLSGSISARIIGKRDIVTTLKGEIL